MDIGQALPNYPPIVWQIYGLIIAVAVVTFIIRQIRSRGKIPVIVLRPTRSYYWDETKAEGNKLMLEKDWSPAFGPECVFTEEKPWYKFWRLPERLIIIGHNAMRALSFKSGKEKDLGDLQYWWTKKEQKQWIYKQEAKAKIQGRPMSMSMFIILLLFLIINLVLALAIAGHLGVI